MACGDCDPCGASGRVPAAVVRLMSERDDWMDKYAEVAQELDELKYHPDCETCGGTRIEEVRAGHGDKKEIPCRDCLRQQPQ